MRCASYVVRRASYVVCRARDARDARRVTLDARRGARGVTELGPSGTMESHLVPSGTIWIHLCPSGTIWIHGEPSGHLDISVSVHLDPSRTMRRVTGGNYQHESDYRHELPVRLPVRITCTDNLIVT